MELEDRVVVVTGAGSGIGEAIARAAHAAGARHVVIADLHGDEAERVAADIGGTALEIDVRDESAIQQMVGSTLDAHGPIDLFVSNAGFVTAAGLEDTNEAIQTMWEVHCMAHIYGARAVLPSMIAPPRRQPSRQRHRPVRVSIGAISIGVRPRSRSSNRSGARPGA